jgi:hypothetical protein
LRGWAPGETVEEKLERLHAQIDQLHGIVRDLRTRIDARLRKHDQVLEAMGADIQRGLQELPDLHAETKRRETETDPRALPVVGYGIVLSGIPEEIASLPTPI